MRIKDIPLNNRPRERFIKYGASVLSDAELLAIILQKGTKEENVIDISNRLINKFGLSKLSKLSINELQSIKGIGPAKAMQIKAIFELVKRSSSIKDKEIYIKSAKDVFNLLHLELESKDQEIFIVLYLNVKNRLIKKEVVTKGVLDASIIHPREVFRGAIKEGAKSIIVVHNHPSGDCSPSEEDLIITKSLIEAGDIVNIKVLDHIIIGRNSFWSYRENYK